MMETPPKKSRKTLGISKCRNVELLKDRSSSELLYPKQETVCNNADTTTSYENEITVVVEKKKLKKGSWSARDSAKFAKIDILPELEQDSVGENYEIDDYFPEDEVSTTTTEKPSLSTLKRKYPVRRKLRNARIADPRLKRPIIDMVQTQLKFTIKKTLTPVGIAFNQNSPATVSDDVEEPVSESNLATFEVATPVSSQNPDMEPALPDSSDTDPQPVVVVADSPPTASNIIRCFNILDCTAFSKTVKS